MNIGLDILRKISPGKRFSLTALQANMDCFLLEQRRMGFLFAFGVFVSATKVCCNVRIV